MPLIPLPDRSTPEGRRQFMAEGMWGPSVRRSLREGGDINGFFGELNALMMACTMSSSVCAPFIEELLARGADIHAVNEAGENALDKAREFGNRVAISMLEYKLLEPASAIRDSSGAPKPLREKRL